MIYSGVMWWVELEYPVSSETWNGGTGRVTFNYLQQRPEEPVCPDLPPVDTDPWGVTDGGFRG